MAAVVEPFAVRANLPKDISSTYDSTRKDEDVFHGLKSGWPVTTDLIGSNLPSRMEGEVGDLVVYGKIPEELDGTFYRVMSDPYFKPADGFTPFDGDGSISAIRFIDGHVDIKIRYVETERLKLERQAQRALFGLYSNPFTHHPCVRAAVDSQANVNVIFWADYLLALKEGGQPYAMDPNTLETLGYDPFRNQVKAKSFGPHPKVDPITKNLVVFGSEAKGLATKDVIHYELDAKGQKVPGSEMWADSPWCSLMHDCVITPNWTITSMWPLEASYERMKDGGLHWAYRRDLPAGFLVMPRKGGKDKAEDDAFRAKHGWLPSETQRFYAGPHCVTMHTGGAWENEDGTISFDTSRAYENPTPWFPEEGKDPEWKHTKIDFVRWSLDLSKPHGSKLKEPEVLVNCPCEFPRVDERFLTQKTNWVFLNAVYAKLHSGAEIGMAEGFDAILMFNTSTREQKAFYVGKDSSVQEPVFVPRHAQAAEADGWVMAMVERHKAGRCDVVILDTNDFSRPIAVIPLPLHLKAQTHGNWVDNSLLKDRTRLIRMDKGIVHASHLGPLGAL